MAYWLVKAEPEDYTIDQLAKDNTTWWTGVRNFQARNNLLAMKQGDLCIFYRSVIKPAAVGIATVTQTAQPDPTVTPDDPKGDWFCTELGFTEKFPKEVTLKRIKAEPTLQNMVLFKQSRLSVQPISQIEFDIIVEIAHS